MSPIWSLCVWITADRQNELQVRNGESVVLIADTTTERSRWLVLIQLGITNQKRASVERGCSKVLTFSQRSETAPWIRQDPKPLRTPAGTAYFGEVAGSTSLTTAAPRATQLRFSYLCFSQIQIWLIQWGLRTLPSIPTDRRYRHCSPPHWLFFEPGRRCSTVLCC